MSATAPRSVVVLGMMSKMPVPGAIWQTIHYLVGLQRLGYEAVYVEAHARTPSMFVEGTADAGSARAARFVARVLHRHGVRGRWAYHALHHDGSVLGMDPEGLRRAYRSADLVLNLCGGTRPREEHAATGRLALVLTDPVQLEVELWQGREDTREFVDAHAAAFSFGENYGRPGCLVPVSPHFTPFPTRQPVVLDLWEHRRPDDGAWTTVANWRQPFRTLKYRREVYHWSKDREFLKFLDLPERSGQPFELALASYEAEDRRLLEEHGWRVRDADSFGLEGGPYRAYLQRSRGEFTVAKDQNVRLRSGWFSDRSATYLAAGRPVVTQDTGFGAVLPTGEGLFPVSDVDGAEAALETVEADYEAARRGALEVARGFFDYRRVLPRMLAQAGVEGPSRPVPVRSSPSADRGVGAAAGVADGAGAADGGLSNGAGGTIPGDLVLEPLSRRPLRLPPETVHVLVSRPVPTPPPSATSPQADPPPHARRASVVVVTHGGLPLTRLCLESVLAHTRHPAFEVVVVDNASPDGTPSWLEALAAADRRVRLVLNPANEGFAAGCNQGARVAEGDVLVFLNSDAVVAPGWLSGLAAALADPSVGAVNPVTNRSGTEAEVGVESGRTYRDFLRRAAERAAREPGPLRDARMLAFFCLALRRETWERVGELDEGFGAGLFEDDDYSRRLLRAGLRLGCVERVLVHHFGEASFGDLVADGTYGRLYDRNRRRFRRKWGEDGQGRAEPRDSSYDALLSRMRDEVAPLLPGGARVAVVSRGDERLLSLGDASGGHFPRQGDGTWAGHYPADDLEAVRQLEDARRQGDEYLLVPRPGFWWLDHYRGLRRHLETAGRLVRRSDDVVLYRLPAAEPATDGGDGAPAATPSRVAPPATDADAPDGGYGGGPAARPAPRAVPVPDHADGANGPVFIIGSPRSGTSVLTWALGQHPNLYPLEETVWFGRFHSGSLQAFRLGSSRGERSQLSAMGIERGEFMRSLGAAVNQLILGHRVLPDRPVDAEQAYARARSPGDPKERWVDGTPENSFHVAGIAELFPGARFVHLLRRPDPVVRSLRRFHAIGGRQHDPDEAYRKWIAHVQACVEAERALGPDRVLRVLHRDLSADPAPVVRACLEFAGESYSPDCLLPLSRRINSSGSAPLPEAEDRAKPDPEVLAEARSLEAELFGDAEGGP